jgi:AcrR family transcriptional regulator
MNTQAVTRGHHRRYHSALRERQMQETREAIFRATAEQLADLGATEFNIPRLAEAAGISIRTVYRYFLTKDDLLEAFAVWLDAQVGSVEPPADIESLLAAPEEVFPAFDEREALIRSQWVTVHGRTVREAGRRHRLAAYQKAMAEVTADLPAAEARRYLALIAYLFSSRTWQTLKDEWGMSGAESGKATSWALRVLVEDVRRRNKEALERRKATDQGKLEGDSE